MGIPESIDIDIANGNWRGNCSSYQTGKVEYAQYSKHIVHCSILCASFLVCPRI